MTNTQKKLLLPVGWLRVYDFIHILLVTSIFVVILLLQPQWLHVLVQEPRDGPQGVVAGRPRAVRR